MISSYLSLFLAVLSFGAVICFHFPQFFTTPEFREVYPIPVMRWLMVVVILLSFGFALTSFLLGAKTRLGLSAILLCTASIALGGPGIATRQFEQSMISVGLDWLLIDIFLLSAIFIPLELFLPQRKDQTKFHLEWKTDLVYFAVAHLLVQVIAMAVRTPAETLFGNLGLESLHGTVSGLPLLLQIFLAMLVADVFQYWAHRIFHSIPFLWRFHSVHHSIQSVDWMAGSRLHLVDVLLTRAFSYLPLYVLGFSAKAFYVYVAIVALQAVAAHANIRVPFGFLRYVLVTPQFHHWHHSDDPSVYNRNFAIHFPWIDRLFGTYHLPGDEWPSSMGLGDQQFPKGYWRQLVYPFTNDPGEGSLDDPSQR